MTIKPKIVFLKSVLPNTASQYYFNAIKKLGIDLSVISFHPHEQQPAIDFPEADLLLLVDCGLPVKFPGIKKYPSPKGYVSIDSCHKLDIHKSYCKWAGFDYIWVAQKHIVSEFGANAQWLPLAADEDIHAYRPEMVTNNLSERLRFRYHYDIGMCGAPYKHRRYFKESFRKAGLSTNFFFRKKFGLQATRETARCTVGFNASAGFTGKKGKDINMRVFETMANGQAMLLTNTYDNLGYEDLFEEGRHYITYRTESEAVEKAIYYSTHPAEAIKVAREGQQHVLNNHTYTHRCKKILSDIAGKV